MSKPRKKRTKSYQGEDAARPVQQHVRRYTAVERGRLGEWWEPRKRFAKPVVIFVGAALLVILSIVELIKLLFLH